MATITSASTIADIRAAYLDNLSYSTDSSVAKAKAFIEACRAILAWPEVSTEDGSTTQFNLEQVAAQLAAAEQWLAANDTTTAGGFGTVKHVDFAGFRD